MKTLLRAGLAALVLTAGVPALAQDIGPTPGGGPALMMGGIGKGRMFQSLSPEGRAVMMEAMQSIRADSNRDGIKAARDKMLTILNAEKLDVVALQRAMLEERNLVQGQHQRAQEAMIAGFQKLSLEDRRAFVTSAREARTWMEQRRGNRRGGPPAQQ